MCGADKHQTRATACKRLSDVQQVLLCSSGDATQGKSVGKHRVNATEHESKQAIRLFIRFALRAILTLMSPAIPDDSST
jgi:hypothetical protein